MHSRNVSSMAVALGMTLGTTILKGVVMILGRRTYHWWNRQTLVQKQNFKEKVKNKHTEIWYTSLIALGLFSGFLVYHIDRDPITGCRRLCLFNDSIMVQLANQDVNMMLKVFKEHNKLLEVTDPGYIRVANLTEKLLNANRNLDVIRKRRWSVVVVNDPNINAFVTPNGFIFVYTGIAACTNDDQLTIIIGHELTHCTNRHLNQMWSFEFVVNVLHLIPIATFWVTLPFFRALVSQIISGIVKDLCLTLPYGRSHEIEADKCGLMLAAKACVDVTEGYKFWISMSKNKEVLTGSSDWLWWISTHPTHRSRAQHLYSLIPEARELQKVHNCGIKEEALKK